MKNMIPTNSGLTPIKSVADGPFFCMESIWRFISQGGRVSMVICSCTLTDAFNIMNKIYIT